MKIRELFKLIKADSFRYVDVISLYGFLRSYFSYPGFKYTLILRICQFVNNKSIILKLFFTPFFMLLRHYRYKYGFDIPILTKIGSGLFISHFGCIIVNPLAKIGENCNLSPGIVIGKQNRGKTKGVPQIGDFVFIGPGSKIIGNIIIGNNAVIGANSVVVNDVPENAVVSGIPAEIISFKGSTGFINRVMNE